MRLFRILIFAARLAAVLLLAGIVSGVTFFLVFLHSSSPGALVWTTALAAMVTVSVGLLVDSRGKNRRRRVVDGLLTTMLVGAIVGAAGWQSGWFPTPPAETPAAAMAHDGYVAVRGGAVFFHQSALADSDRPVLLILHGGPGSGSVSLRAALEEPLASSLRTIFFDQRSVGRSSAVSSFTLDDYLDDMERVRRALNVDSWYLFGVSWGAALANEYAVRHPNRVRGVITWGGLVANQPVTRSMVKQLRLFYAANADRRGTAWCRELEEQTSPYTRLQTVRVMNAVNRAGLKTVLPEESATAAVVAARDLAVRRWGYTASQTGTGLWATVATYMQERLETYDFRPRLPALTMPYLLLAGAHDPLLRDAGVADYARATPHATAKWILDSGHTLDRADVIASEIVGFVSAHSAE